MDRKDRSKPPRPDMVWSQKHKMWVDPDTRSPERRSKDEAISQSIEADRERIQEALKQAQKAYDEQSKVLEGAADHLALSVLQQLVDARKKSGLTQVEVARRMNVPPSAVVRLESGAHSPTLSTISRYAAAIGVKLEVRRIA